MQNTYPRYSGYSGFGNASFGDASPPTGFSDPVARVATVAMPQWDVPFVTGARSEMVATLQTLLNSRGWVLGIDGVVGPRTQRAVESAFMFLSGSASMEARRLSQAGWAGMSVAALVNTFARAFAALDTVTRGGNTDVPTSPSEPDGTIRMTPRDAAAMDRRIQGGWGGLLAVAGFVGVGWALYRVAR